MGEGHIQKFVRSARLRTTIFLVLAGLLLLALALTLKQYFDLTGLKLMAAVSVCYLLVSIALGFLLTSYLTKPFRYLAQAIFHISPTEHITPAPKMDELGLGKELIDSLSRIIYSLSSTAGNDSETEKASQTTVLDMLPVPIIGLDEQNRVVFANSQAINVLKIPRPSGYSLDDALKISYNSSEQPIQVWIQACHSSSMTAKQKWQRTTVSTDQGGPIGYFDIFANFSRHNSSGIDTMLVLNDHSDLYTEEQSALSFIAMAVHELRTPLTAMRGYIEVFEDELSGKLDDELSGFMQKMSASAQSLTTFVSNILNVARIDQNQLSLRLNQEDWATVLKEAVAGMNTRAKAHGKEIALSVESDLPPVAVDRVTIGEVIINLLDNAIKYSPEDATRIEVTSWLSAEGTVETIVKDQGVGIPTSVVPHLFTKFYRNHRTRAQIGGTGLGLYLCKAIVSAHKGNIWVRSQEGKGSIFGFTVLPYSKLAETAKNNNNEEITHSPHGWIKNHSMQRR